MKVISYSLRIECLVKMFCLVTIDKLATDLEALEKSTNLKQMLDLIELLTADTKFVPLSILQDMLPV